MNESDATRVGSFNEEVVQLENIVGILVEKWRYQVSLFFKHYSSKRIIFSPELGHSKRCY